MSVLRSDLSSKLLSAHYLSPLKSPKAAIVPSILSRPTLPALMRLSAVNRFLTPNMAIDGVQSSSSAKLPVLQRIVDTLVCYVSIYFEEFSVSGFSHFYL